MCDDDPTPDLLSDALLTNPPVREAYEQSAEFHAFLRVLCVHLPVFVEGAAERALAEDARRKLLTGRMSGRSE